MTMTMGDNKQRAAESDDCYIILAFRNIEVTEV